MKHLHITFLLFVLMSMISNKVQAHDIAVNNTDGVTIYYVWTNSKTELVVSFSSTYSKYTGKVVIPESVTYNGNLYPVTRIGEGAFYGCTGLTSITIPNSVTSIDYSAFEDCTGLSNVRFMDGDNALKFSDANNSKTFANCPITTLYLGRNLSYQYSPFQSLNTLKDVTIGNNVTSIGNSTFYGCTGITSIEIPNRVKDIGQSSFYGCSYLASVKIGNGVTSIGKDAFYGCSNLSAVHIENLTNWCSISFENSDANPLCCAKHLYLGNNEINDLVIPNNVTQISFSSFYGCTGFTSIKIPTSVTSIGNFAFSGCTGLTSLEIPNSVSNLGNNAFYDCNYLLKVTIESNSIVSKSYSYSYSLKNIFGAQVQQYIIGENVSSIGDYAFYGYNQSTSIALPDNITQIGYNAIPSNVMLFVNKGTKTLLTCWNKSFIPYDKQTEVKLMAPALSVEDITQTNATVNILNTDLKDRYNYSINNEVVNDINIKYTALRPETTQQLKLVVSLDDVHYDVTSSFTTKGMNAKVDDDYKVTASSIRATGSYTEEDAKVIAQRMYILNQPSEGNECFASGLNPGRSYTIICEIDVDYGGESIETYRASRNIYPARLQFNVAQPKVVKIGNAIVSATVNLDPEEENIGFEWRRTDWTDEFPSNTGQAYLYEGVIEGYIKNLNTDKLWKFRPYYLSDDGTYHYGDWMGLDPTNTSYFEPTVHTYARINIEGNTALVRGYALAGTENIKVQGFKYWKTSQGSNASHQAPSVPANAKTIVATGQQIITATLAALDYNSVYHYVAFVTTEDGTTYYGEEQVFSTPTAPAGIDDVIANSPANMKKGVYTLTGVKLADELSELQGLPQGVYIIDGKKVMVK